MSHNYKALDELLKTHELTSPDTLSLRDLNIRNLIMDTFNIGYEAGVKDRANVEEQEAAKADESGEAVSSPVDGNTESGSPVRGGARFIESSPELGERDVQAEVTRRPPSGGSGGSDAVHSTDSLLRMQDSIQDLTAIGRDLAMAGIKPKFIPRRIKQYQTNIDEIQAGKPLSTLHYSG